MDQPEPSPAMRDLLAAVEQTRKDEIVLRAALAKVDFKDASLNIDIQNCSIEDLLRFSQAILDVKETK